MVLQRGHASSLAPTDPRAGDARSMHLEQAPGALSRLPAGGRLVIVSNRGPLSIVPDDVSPDRLTARRGSGGLVTALGGIAAHLPVTWVAAALEDGDRIAARSRRTLERIVRAALPDQDLELVLEPLPASIHDPYYRVVANPFLWFLQHGLVAEARAVDRPTLMDAWTGGYRPANERLAAAAVRAVAGADHPIIWVHDYQLYLAPALIRAARPDATIGHFTHIPWPEPATWAAAPATLVRELVGGLLGADVVTFQTSDDVRAFLRTVEATTDARIDRRTGLIHHEGRRVEVLARPISLEPAAIRAVAASPAVERRVAGIRQRLAREGEPALVVRVDRLDPTKNSLAGFLAFEVLLERRPDLVPLVRFLAVMAPSRTGLAAYDDYARLVEDVVRRVNERFRAAAGNDVIRVDRDGGYEHAVSTLRTADVVLVNPVADGMNLVAKEAALVNERDAAIILSNRAGAARELAPFAIGVEPTDVAATAEALERALGMDAGERHRRLVAMRVRVERYDLRRWLALGLADLARVRRGSLRRVLPRPLPMRSRLAARGRVAAAARRAGRGYPRRTVGDVRALERQG